MPELRKMTIGLLKIRLFLYRVSKVSKVSRAYWMSLDVIGCHWIRLGKNLEKTWKKLGKKLEQSWSEVG